MNTSKDFFSLKITPDDTLRERGYDLFGAVILIKDVSTGRFLWIKSTVNKPVTQNNIGQWQCFCETAYHNEPPLITASRGLREELDDRPDVLRLLKGPFFLGETPFLPDKNIMARVFLFLWTGQVGFTGFSLGTSSETTTPVWLDPKDPFPGALRPGVFHVLLNLGEQVSLEALQGGNL